MAMTVGSGLTSITGNVTVQNVNGLPVPSAAQTLKYFSGQGTGADQTFATVTAGKTAYLIGVTCRGAAGATGILYDGTGTAAIVHVGVTAANQAYSVISSVPLTSYAGGAAMKASISNQIYYTVIWFEQ